jgi:putative serine protease PepD
MTHQPPKPRRLSRTAVAVIAAATLAAGGVGGTVGALLGGDEATPPTTASATTASATTPTDVSAVVAKVEQSVVQINVRTAAGEVVGSGVLVGDGRIITNNHVVANPGQLRVTLADGGTVDATIEGTDPDVDLAVLTARDVSDIPSATLADSDQVKVGDEVIAIGSPNGLRGTVTTGIVSALDREVHASDQEQTPYQVGNRQQPTSYRAIQTDASINQGNSGGPLFDTDGKVIGINSAMYSPVTGPDGSAGSVGIGFAIPSNDAKQVLDKV